jgi:hypothetical protein
MDAGNTPAACRKALSGLRPRIIDPNPLNHADACYAMALILPSFMSDAPGFLEKKTPIPKSLLKSAFDVVEVRRLELLTPYMRSKCSTS